ncbi:hypothetical protein PGT21_003309 [Puccinia graminis f. sp. tritici]|uniref:Uncharacterized protein n=1 Tax=Puccinia graminis f. sp. tritici TaxID=56615 RepID=A0A5B0LLG6_PUCGR|nr:hypothetical protein PGT21_003309 [Puccinia graminis f. sp. tritici]
MEPPSTPCNSESTADQPGPSPVGVRPVEEPVQPQPQPGKLSADIFQPPPGPPESDAGELAREEAWLQLLAPLTPRQRIDIQRYADVTTVVWEQLAANPEASPQGLAAADDYLENIDNFERTLDGLPQRTIDRVEEFFSHMIQQIGQLIQEREDRDLLRQNVDPFLDVLINTNLTSLLADGAQRDCEVSPSVRPFALFI